MKRGFLIYNPSAGIRRKSETVLSDVIAQFEKQGIEITPNPTEAGGSVIQQVREILTHNPDLIVSWGGDGTVNEVVNGIYGSKVPLGILPGGTANLLARELKIPYRLDQAINVIGRGNTRVISVGEANGRKFVLMAGIGFDSHVIQNVDWNLKKKVGKLAFGYAALTSARSYQFPTFTLRINGEEKDCCFAVICNAKEYAAYFMLTPDANISDEYFYVCLFKEAGFTKFARYFLHAYIRKHDRLKSVEIIRTKELEAIGNPSIAVQADGELVGSLPMRFTIHPHSLEVFC